LLLLLCQNQERREGQLQQQGHAWLLAHTGLCSESLHPV
jgi:hypothetical protein